MATRSQPNVWDLLTLGGTIAGCVVGGIVLGWLIDRAAGTLPVFILVGLGIGIVAGIMAVYSKIRSYLS
jgi:F0F1-type ATP synthase assembly protein I